MFSSLNNSIFGKAPATNQSIFSTNTPAQITSGSIFDNSSAAKTGFGVPSTTGSLFGSTNQNTSQNSLFGNTFPPSNNTFNNFNAPKTNLFDTAQSTQSPFGSANTNNNTLSGSSLFNATQPQSTSMFGSTAQPQTTSLFGSTTQQPTTSLFDANKPVNNTFLPFQIMGTKNITWRDEYRQDLAGRIQCITNLPDINQNKTLEELRWEDYQLQRCPKKPTSTFASTQPKTTSGLFGTSITTPANTNLFGSTSSLFGNSQPATTSQPSTGLFGSMSGSGVFDMNKPAATNVFGNQPTTGFMSSTNTFGNLPAIANQNTNTSTSLFGSQDVNNNSLFKPAATNNIMNSTTTPTTSLFGSTNNSFGTLQNTNTTPSTGLFGSTQPSNTSSLFGLNKATAPTPGGGLFGTTSSTNAVAPTTTSSLFGGNTQTNPVPALPQPTGGLFSSTDTNSLAPKAQPFSGGLFGSTTDKPSTFLPNSNLFSTNNPTTSSISQPGSSVMNTPFSQSLGNTTNTSLFNTQPAGQSLGMRGLFGSTTQPKAPSMFGSSLLNSTTTPQLGANTQSLFGTGQPNLTQTTQPSLFNTGSSLYGNTATTGTLTGGNVNLNSSLGGTNPSSNFSFNNLSNTNTNVSNTTANTGTALQSAVSLIDPYGLSRLQKHSNNYINTSLGGYSVANPFNFPVTGVILPTHYRTCRSATFAQLWKPLPEYSAEHRRQPVSSSITPKRISRNRPSTENRSANKSQIQSESQQQIIDTWSPFPQTGGNPECAIGAGIYSSRRKDPTTEDDLSGNFKESTSNKNFSPSVSAKAKHENLDSDLYIYGSNPNQLKSIRKSIEDSRISDASLWLSQSILWKPAQDSINNNEPKTLITTETPPSEPKLSKTPLTNIFKEFRYEKLAFKRNVILTQNDYTLRPSLEVLETYTEDQLANVIDFTVIRGNYGEIMWIGVTDIRGINIDQTVKIEKRAVEVYPEAYLEETRQDVPPVGVGLNKPAIVTLYNCGPKTEKLSKNATEEEKQALYESHVRNMRQYTEKLGAQFISISQDGVWKFRVEHFSRYALQEGDIDDNDDGGDINFTAGNTKKIELDSKKKIIEAKKPKNEKSLEDYYKHNFQFLLSKLEDKKDMIKPDFQYPPKLQILPTLKYYAIDKCSGSLNLFHIEPINEYMKNSLDSFMQSIFEILDRKIAINSTTVIETDKIILSRTALINKNDSSLETWSLIKLLYGSLAPIIGVLEEDELCQESRQRLHLFSQWLKHVNRNNTKLSDFADMNDTSSLRRVDEALYYITHNDMEKAVNCLLTPVSSNNQDFLHLALCVASLGAAANASPINRESHYRQLCTWQKQGLYTKIPSQILRIHHIIAGCIDQLVAAKMPDWRTLLALLIWFLSPDATLYIRQNEINNQKAASELLNAHFEKQKISQQSKKRSRQQNVFSNSSQTDLSQKQKSIDESPLLTRNTVSEFPAVHPRTSQVIQRAIESYEKLLNRKDSRAPLPVSFYNRKHATNMAKQIESPQFNLLKLYSNLITCDGLSNLFEPRAYTSSISDATNPWIIFKILNDKVRQSLENSSVGSAEWMENTRQYLDACLFNQLDLYNLWWWKIVIILSEIFLKKIQLYNGIKIIYKCVEEHFFNFSNNKISLESIKPFLFVIYTINIPNIFYFQVLSQGFVSSRNYLQAAYYHLNAFLYSIKWNTEIIDEVLIEYLEKHADAIQNTIESQINDVIKYNEISTPHLNGNLYERCLSKTNVNYTGIFKTTQSFFVHTLFTATASKEFQNLIFQISNYIQSQLSALLKLSQYSFIASDSIEPNLFKMITYEELYRDIHDIISQFIAQDTVDDITQIEVTSIHSIFFDSTYNIVKIIYLCVYITQNVWIHAEWCKSSDYLLCLYVAWALNTIAFIRNADKNENLSLTTAVQLIKIANILLNKFSSLIEQSDTRNIKRSKQLVNKTIQETFSYLTIPNDLSSSKPFKLITEYQTNPSLIIAYSVLQIFDRLKSVHQTIDPVKVSAIDSTDLYCNLLCLPPQSA